MLLKARNAPIAIRHHMPLSAGEADPQQSGANVTEVALMGLAAWYPPQA
jgi:hypothetical protein